MATWIAQNGSNATAHSWSDLKISADAKTILAAFSGGVIFSRDAGATWTQVALTGTFKGVALSRDGNHMVACTDGSGIYISHDGGKTWPKKNTTSARWNRVGISADGNTIIAGGPQTSPYKSTDGGTTWTILSGAGTDSNAVGISADGTVMAVGMGTVTGNLFVSRDGGATWAKSGNTKVFDFALNTDGSWILAASYGTYPYISNNFGSTWISLTHASTGFWTAVGISDNANTLSVTTGGNLYTSTDTGNTWTVQAPGGTGNFIGAAVSGDGMKFATARANNPVFTLDTTPVYPTQTWKTMYFGSTQVQALYLGANQFWVHP